MSRAWLRLSSGILPGAFLAGCSTPERASHCLGQPDLDIWQSALVGEVSPLIGAPGTGGFAGWPPDGDRLLFVAGRDGNCEIYLANAVGSSEIDLTNSDEHGDPLRSGR